MDFKHEFKKPIHREDLMPVLGSGIFMSFTGGLIIGVLHLVFMYYLQFSLTWLFLLILAHLIAKRIQSSYQNYHILYSFLSIFFFIISFYLMNVTLTTGIYFISNVINTEIAISLLNPLLYFRFLNPFRTNFFGIDNILEVIFFIVGIIYSYRFSK